MKDGTTQTVEGQKQNADFLINGSTHFFQTLIKINSDVMKNSLDASREVLAFSQARLQANIETWKALTACRNPSDLPTYQAEFTKKAAAQYSDAASKIGNRLASVILTATLPLPEPAQKS